MKMFLLGFLICYLISAGIIALYESDRLNYIGEKMVCFFYLLYFTAIPFVLIYSFILAPFWNMFCHVIWPPRWFNEKKAADMATIYPMSNKREKNGKPWAKRLSRHWMWYYNGDRTKRRYAYSLAFVK